jgi:hypothetical protein
MPPDPPFDDPTDQADLEQWCIDIGADPPALEAIAVTEEPPDAPYTTIYWKGHPEGERLAPMAPLPPANVLAHFVDVTDAPAE